MKNIPVKLGHRFREKETSQLLQAYINQDIKLVSLLGLRGIGKSSLARNALWYAAERKMFIGGILFVQCKEIRSCHTLLKFILRSILKVIDLSEQKKTEMVEALCSEDKLKDYLKDFFNGNRKEPFVKKRHKSQRGDRELFMLCLDNIEEMILNDEDGDFKTFLAELYDECSDLRILVTSILTLGTLPNEVVPEVQIVRSLKTASSAKLFFDRCGDLDTDQLVEFIFEDKNYPYHKMLCLKDKGIHLPSDQADLTED